MHRVILAIALVAALALAAPAAAQTGIAEVDETISDVDETIEIVEERGPELVYDAVGTFDCTEPAPTAIPSIASSPRIELRVLGLLEGVPVERAQETMAKVRDLYAPLGIDVVATYRPATFSSDDATTILEEAKAAVGGQRPSWAHIVWAFTDRNIADGSSGTSVLGKADCIGGISDPARSFAVSEKVDAQPAQVRFGLPFWLLFEPEAIAVAHEIGHLLGAHHHMANCGEGTNPEEPQKITPCTLMFNDVSLSRLKFGSTEKPVVRGYTEAYVEPIDEPLPPSEL